MSNPNPDTDLRPGEIAVALPAATDAGIYFIGKIHTPWLKRQDCPKRGSPDGPVCCIVVDDRWRDGLTDLAGHKRVQVLYWMHQARRDLVLQTPLRTGAISHNLSRETLMPVIAERPADVVREVLHRQFGVYKNSEKLLARAANVSINTASNWLRGRASPSLDNLIPLLASCDELADAINRLIQEQKKLCSGEQSLSNPAGSVATSGTFALRSPVRPNPIASSVVELIAIVGNILHVRGLDCLDGTPLIDLKPDRLATAE